jgi:S1-C subfamily serine protease
MRRTALYSNSPRSRVIARRESPSSGPGPEKPVEPRARPKWRDLYTQYERNLLLGVAVLLAVLWLSTLLTSGPLPQTVSRQAIDAAVARALAEQAPPSPAAKVYESVKGAIVAVRAIGDALETDEYLQKSAGTGVVVVNRGTILTSLHVIAGAGRIRVQFADGLESDARVVVEQPENDLAVLQADTVPDDLAAALMRPRADLQPGDAVVAVGFPFGIGPSVSAGVVSGLRREFRSPGGARLSDLIQFDAAVNPGSSGGPLLNAAGEVVGIVTAMLDPGGGGFAGIGFAVPIESAASAAGSPPF